MVIQRGLHKNVTLACDNILYAYLKTAHTFNFFFKQRFRKKNTLDEFKCILYNFMICLGGGPLLSVVQILS